MSADGFLPRRACVKKRWEGVVVDSSSRRRPLKLSTLPFCIGRPGSMKCGSISTWAAQRSIALLVNSENSRQAAFIGKPREDAENTLAGERDLKEHAAWFRNKRAFWYLKIFPEHKSQ